MMKKVLFVMFPVVGLWSVHAVVTPSADPFTG